MKSNTSAANFIKNYNDYRSNYFCHLRFLESSTKSSIDIFSVVGENSYAKDKLRKIYFPSEKDMLGRKLEYNNRISLKEILDWDLNIIEYYAMELNQYLALKFKYEKCFFQEQYMDAWELLCEIERKCGYSLWLIEQQFGVLYCLNAESEVEKIFSYYKMQTDSMLIRNILSFLKWRKDVNVNFDKYMNYGYYSQPILITKRYSI